jgi:predicted nucleic acid-binding Zn ribbon protein
MERKCLECGENFHGRADKKFCSDQCRNAYNNKQKSTAGMAFIRKVNGILARNRNILETMNPEGKTTLHRSKLQKQGLDLDYITHLYTTKAGRVYYFCYDQGYSPVGNDFYVLVRRDVNEVRGS